MRWFAGIGAAVVALLLGAVFFLMDALVQRQEVRSVVEELGQAALGRKFSYEALEVGLFPPAVVIVRPAFTGADGVVAAAADRVEARIALLPMLFGDVVIQGIQISGADIALVRTEEGVHLAGKPTAAAPADAKGGDLNTGGIFDAREEAVQEVEESSGARVAIRTIGIRDTHVSFTDHSADPPIELSFEEVRGTGNFPDGNEPGPLKLSARLGIGVPVAIDGALSLDGHGALHFEIADLPVELLRSYLGEDAHIEGSTDLAGDVAFGSGGVTSLSVALSGHEVLMEVGEASFAGDLPVSVDLKPVDGRLAGTFALDATQMSLKSSDFFDKPVGGPFSLEGRIRLLEGGGVELRGDNLHAGPANGRLDLTTDPTFRTVLDAPPFEVAPFLVWFPGLSDVASHGRLGADALALTFGPLTVGGTVTMDGLGLPLENGADSRLDGRLVGTGTTIHGKDLRLHVAEQPFSADLVVDLAPGGEVSLDFLGDGLESGAIFDAFGAPPGMLTGKGHLDGAFRLPREGEAVLLDRLKGRVRAEIVDGRWKGVSLLQEILGATSLLAEPLIALGRAEGGRDVQRFYTDGFERISGTFTVSDGIATTDDLKIEYRTYVVDLDGDIGLADQSLDMTGKLTIFSEADHAISGALGTESAGVSRTIPLAGVKGTLQDPKVTVADEAVRAFLAGVLFSRQGAGVKEALDKALGEGAGKFFEKLIGGDSE